MTPAVQLMAVVGTPQVEDAGVTLHVQALETVVVTTRKLVSFKNTWLCSTIVAETK